VPEQFRAHFYQGHLPSSHVCILETAWRSWLGAAEYGPARNVIHQTQKFSDYEWIAFTLTAVPVVWKIN
jgi:hypothetical protein